MPGRRYSPEYYRIALKLFRNERKKRDMLQYEMANRLGLNHESYNRIENGREPLTDANLEAILTLLGITPAELNAFVRSSGGSADPIVEPIDQKVIPDRVPQPATAPNEGELVPRGNRDEGSEEARGDAAARGTDGAASGAGTSSRAQGVAPALAGAALAVLLASVWLMSARHPLPWISKWRDPQNFGGIIQKAEVYENLTIYGDPESFRKRDLGLYWVEDGPEAGEIEKSVLRLLNKQWHYGAGSRLESFEVRGVATADAGRTADVETVESWYLPMYDSSNQPVPFRNPYFRASPTRYHLRKQGVRWLIESTSTPRAP